MTIYRSSHKSCLEWLSMQQLAHYASYGCRHNIELSEIDSLNLTTVLRRGEQEPSQPSCSLKLSVALERNITVFFGRVSQFFLLLRCQSLEQHWPGLGGEDDIINKAHCRCDIGVVQATAIMSCDLI